MRRRLLLLGLAILSFFVLWIALVSSYAGTPRVEIQVESQSFGISQMYFASEENAFSERTSAKQPLAIGVNTLRFPVSITRGTVGDFQRWDPSDEPGSFVVSQVTIANAFLRETIPLDSLRPAVAIGGFVSTPSGIEFTTDSNDAQILLDSPLRSFYFKNAIVLAGIAIALTAVIFLALFGWLRHRRGKRIASSTTARSLSLPDRSETRFLTLIRVGALLALLAVIASLAWLSDDALITIRTALNAANGYGPVFNIDERVQAFTHPVWFGLLWFAGWFTGQWMLMPMILGIVSTTVAVVLVVWNTSVPSRIVVGVFALLMSNAFVEYATSGLENALSYALLAGLILAAHRLLLQPAISWSLGLGVLSGALLLTRLDLALLILPLLVWIAIALSFQIKQIAVIAGAAGFLLIGWFSLSLGYYGTFLPTTFTAKTNVDIPRSELVSAGLHYIGVSLLYDPVTLAILASGIALGAIVGSGVTRAVMTGVLLYLGYITWIGGDFMAGRFLAVPVFATVAVLLLERRGAYVALLPADAQTGSPQARRSIAALGSVALLVPLFVLGQGRSDAITPALLGKERWEIDDRGGITDERGYHLAARRGMWDYLGNRRPVARVFDVEPGEPIPDKARDLVALQVSAATWPRGATTREVDSICGGLGERSILSGPSVHFIDPCGLTDPFLASIPFLASDFDWRAGHFVREVPNGYFDAVRIGDPQQLENQDLRPQLEAMWRRIRP